MKPADDDIRDRRPVWEALSLLFLDTELQSSDLDYMANVLASSPYGLDEIETILFDEVYPVCIGNMRGVAGEWAGFDGDWLREAILRRGRSRFKLPRWMQTSHWMIREPWQKVVELFRQRRAISDRLPVN